jgi:2'-5' RNA ligase
MRVFIALPLPPPVCVKLKESAEGLKTQYPGLKIVRNEGIHITLFFFGEIPEIAVNTLKTVMDNPALKYPKIKVSLGNWEQFPTRGNPRVIYVDIKEGKEQVLSYFETYRQLIADNGWPRKREEKPFVPHITIARNKRERINPQFIKQLKLPDLSFFIDRFVLFQSILKRTGAEYFPLKTIMF